MPRKLSEEHKRKIGEANKGRVPWIKGIGHSAETKRKISKSEKGKAISPETRRRMSEAARERYQNPEERKKMSRVRRGAKGANWKGGVAPENKKIREGVEYRLWREAVFARDNWICQKTGERGGELHPHHIQNFADYPELRFETDNGITLGGAAHRKFHKKYGIKNNTRGQLKEFLKELKNGHRRDP